MRKLVWFFTSLKILALSQHVVIQASTTDNAQIFVGARWIRVVM